MKSGVHSSVHLMTANAPSTAVQSHRSLSSGVRKSVVGNILSATTTNEFLKGGGTLPPVLPSEIYKESSSKRLCKNVRQPQTVQKMYPIAETAQINPNVENTHKVTKMDSELCSKENSGVNDLERKMEQLSSKLSKVQDILCDHMNNEGSKSTIHNIGKSQRFSAHDYALLMLEMNGNIPSHPYDPNEFSDENGCY